MMKKVFGLFFASLLLTACHSETPKPGKETEKIEQRKAVLPLKEHGYSQLPSKLITDESAYRKFLHEIERAPGFNRKAAVLDALRSAPVDFSRKNLLFYRWVEPSGSIAVKVGSPKRSSNRMYLHIEQKIPDVGTADMAYYAVAYLIPKDLDEIIIYHGKQKVRISNKASEMIVPMNCLAWFDGCNHCGRKEPGEMGMCTLMACLAYRPQDFRCTKWAEQ